MPLIIVVAGIALLLLLTIKIKLNTFVSLIIVSIAVAIASGMDLSKVVTSVESGLGGTLGHIGLIFGFGVMLGRLLADAGGAQPRDGLGQRRTPGTQEPGCLRDLRDRWNYRFS